jgi:hypothetical protein
MASTTLSMTRRNQLVKYLECGNNGYSRNRSESLGDIVLRASQRVSDSIREAKEAEFTAACTARRESAYEYAKSYVVDEDWAALAKYLGEETAKNTFTEWVLRYDADDNGPMPARPVRDASDVAREVISEAQSKLRDAREAIMLTDSVMIAEQTIGEIKVYLRGLERRLTA